MARTLQAPVTVAFDYTRSTGPVLGRFFTGLRDGVLVGGRTSSGRVLVPPPEFDPDTHEETTDFVEVSTAGTVIAWSWCPEPVAGQPLDRPFAWVQVRLDGADGTLLHALDADSPDDVETGMRVQVRWTEERVGAITDIACLEPESVVEQGPAQGSGVSTTLAALAAQPPENAITGIITPVELDYLYAASPEESAFYRGLEEGRIIGQRCPVCHKVYVPPRSACPVDGVATTDEVELSDRGTVTTFCIVNVPFLGQKITPPYVSAYVLLDGADIAFLHLILDIAAEEVRMGMRVEAVWKPREEWGTTIENISHFRPTGEPDADFETYKVHL
jgi:uncharacterized protein